MFPSFGVHEALATKKFAFDKPGVCEKYFSKLDSETLTFAGPE